VHHGSGDSFALAEQCHYPGAGGDQGAVCGGGAGQGHGVSGVVDLGVVVLDRSDQGVAAQRRREFAGTATGQMPMVGEAACPAPEEAQGVVEGDPRTRVEPFPPVVLQRVEERHGSDEMWGEGLDQQGALPQRLADQPEVQHLQVAQAAVDELAGPAGRAGGEVPSLYHAHSQTPGGGVQGTTVADDPATHDEDVQHLGRHPVEAVLALAR
jgi:hypothetical protein